MLAINLNQFVRARLTEAGRARYLQYQAEIQRGIHAAHHSLRADVERLQREQYAKVDEEGRHEFQLWVFMCIFYPFMYNGSEKVVEENTIYLVPELPESDG